MSPQASEDTNRTVCFCYAVSEGQIRQAIRTGAASVAEIREQTQATLGCGGCEWDVLEVLESEQDKG